MRKIIHIDMDAFYASVEIRDNPKLRNKPVIVGGMPGTRGVVCTCSYEARKYGVHSGMSANKAAKLCPRGIFLYPRREAYLTVSRQIRGIFHDYTDIIEPLSLDEAYLDVSSNHNKRDIPYATRIAREIRARIRRETGGLTASAGVSFNKFFAKVASDLKKPDGLTVILPENALEFVKTLPIGKFYGVGHVTEKLFLEMGIRNGGDLLRLSREDLMRKFGKNGLYYYEIARGIDNREVCAVWERKSLGTEETFESDITDTVQLYEVLCAQADEVAADLEKKSLSGRTITLKIKFFDFRSVTRSHSLDHYTRDPEEIRTVLGGLLNASDAGKIPVRLIGATVSNFEEKPVPLEDGTLFQPELPWKSR